MFAPVEEVLSTPAVLAIVGASGIWGSGIAPADQAAPYVVWQTVADDPYVQLSGAPEDDRDEVQIDIYSAIEAQSNALARAVRDALDDAGVVNALVFAARETATKLFRISLRADFIHTRQ
ncbi:DUF3168 domain-containing protein [Achromobacter xylosoxidans]|uniref:DUF3168 domain-containing protein n=1 Tax=Alcaligenes xylosoxydans xylosoxydans TaxID=85698 RepID=A0A1R1JV67_ALCXX|nr:DUF3168 domain-containing protein [Achromobacter xylosoxidans]OMG88006.1 hypothetical protein BIZ92_10440 [Achromobacter xylosoxidans]